MRIFIKYLWVVSWTFFFIWSAFICKKIGLDVVMPMKYQAPLVLSFFGPPFIWVTYELFLDGRKRLDETIEDKFDINR